MKVQNTKFMLKKRGSTAKIAARKEKKFEFESLSTIRMYRDLEDLNRS